MGEEGGKDGSGGSVVRWERFLPRMVLRVLLVEADDSTRQIIAALLRKCSYRVAAVSDGLKAWELLKGRPRNIDLILTEVDLPSISGYALLTLTMEHEICKKIPVIMMSSHDSVSTVYNCMLRGAADFLVKPVRKNELRNLWQHVWRRRASSGGGRGLDDETVVQQKVEATAENNAGSDHSSGYIARIQRSRECVEKGSDAQSSCTKPDLEAERPCLETIQNPSEPSPSKFPSNEEEVQKREEHVQKPLADATEPRGPPACKDAYTVTEGGNMQPGSCREHPDITVGACDNGRALDNARTEPIDLIGAFNNHSRYSYRSSDSKSCRNNSDLIPFLDLSLRRSDPSSSVNQVTVERQKLHHSDASAFSRYVNKVSPSLPSPANLCNQQRVYSTTSEKQSSNHILSCDSDTRPYLSARKNVLSLTTPSEQAETSLFCPQQEASPSSGPAKALRFEDLCEAYGSVMPPIFRTQSGQLQSQIQGLVTNREAFFQANPVHPSNSETKHIQQHHDLRNGTGNRSSNQIEQQQLHKLKSLEDQARMFSSNDQSESSSFGNGAATYYNSIGRSNGYVNPNVTVRATSESGNEGNSQRSIQREAALTKFRLKRKDRCFEKKVRYESRRKLAEQRPRVKGQFVRQLNSDPAAMETDNH